MGGEGGFLSFSLLDGERLGLDALAAPPPSLSRALTHIHTLSHGPGEGAETSIPNTAPRSFCRALKVLRLFVVSAKLASMVVLRFISTSVLAMFSHGCVRACAALNLNIRRNRGGQFGPQVVSLN